MRPVVLPPDPVFRAYADLINHVFVQLRSRAGQGNLSQAELFDLADAMHNVGDLIADYGMWTDDEKYRSVHLQPCDSKWNTRLVEFLEDSVRDHSK